MEDRKQEANAEEGELSNGLNVKDSLFVNLPDKTSQVAFVGCTHGELDTIYTTIAEIENAQQTKIELLLCCGDFEAVRNSYDLDCLAGTLYPDIMILFLICTTGPAKYHFFKDFYKVR